MLHSAGRHPPTGSATTSRVGRSYGVSPHDGTFRWLRIFPPFPKVIVPSPTLYLFAHTTLYTGTCKIPTGQHKTRLWFIFGGGTFNNG